ncbi:MAG: hypothetical protein IPP88_24120 [Betaproteobacteria bacterium]|nr:hypothetical protein [Betaproteobacteria bacterium]
MLREEFGVFGTLGGASGDVLLAKAIILAGLVPGEFAAQFERPNIRATEWDTQFALVTDKALPDAYSRAITVWPDLDAAQQVLRSFGEVSSDKARFSSVVEECWARSLGARFPVLRLAVTHVLGDMNLHPLAELLVQAGTGVCSVLFATRIERDLQWNWPLQIGVPDTPAGQRLLKSLEQGRYRHLYQPRVVVTSGPNAGAFDLLLLPEALVPESPLSFDLGAMTAGAVVLMEGEPPPDAEKLQPFTEFAMRRANFGLTGVCFVVEADWLAWINTLIRELSHNATLDHALFQARHGEQRRWEGSTMPARDFAPPFLAGDPWFLEQARIAQTTLRIADSMQTSPHRGIANTDIVTMGAELARDAARRQWISERGDALDVVEKRRKAEAVIGPLQLAPIRATDATPEFARVDKAHTSRAVPRMQTAAKPPAAADMVFTAPAAAAPIAMAAPPMMEEMAASAGDEPPRERARKSANKPADKQSKKAPKEAPAETRHVQCKILRGKSGADAVKRLEARKPYRAHIHIGADIEAGTIRADTPFDESQLPPSEDGHDLQVVFCPLDIRTGKGGIVAAKAKTIHLPKSGVSEIAKFSFETGDDGQAFRARILIMHRNRILQTLMLAAPTIEAEFALRQENLVSPAYASSASEEPADLALVINDNPAGIPGITTVANGNATFSEPAGLNMVVDTIQSLLSKANVSTAGETLKLDHPALVALMIQLATQGAALTRELTRQMNLPDFQLAARIQVVEARSKAYLPVEFVYTGKAPNIDAKLCPNAQKALAAKDGSVHASCKHANDPKHICPAAFWGFSKCIERHPFGQTDLHVFNIPQPGAETLAPFNIAVLAASEKVTPADLTGKDGVKPAIAALAKTVRMATSWEDWKKDILAKPHATLLVLLPHSDNSPDFVNTPALEIQKKWLTSVQLDADFVQAPNEAGPGPVVLLLGCSTALADIPFLNFVREFKAAGASIVLGTLATVHGTHATRFVRTLLGKIKDKGIDAKDKSAKSKGRPFDEILLEVKREMLAEGEPFVLSLAAYGHSSWRIQS